MRRMRAGRDAAPAGFGLVSRAPGRPRGPALRTLRSVREELRWTAGAIRFASAARGQCGKGYVPAARKNAAMERRVARHPRQDAHAAPPPLTARATAGLGPPKRASAKAERRD